MRPKMTKTSLVSATPLALAAALLAGGCDEQALEQQQDEAAQSFRAPGFAARVAEMARAAKQAYDLTRVDVLENDPPTSLDVNGVDHHIAGSFTDVGSNRRVVVYEHQTCQTASIVVSFRGTDITDCSDLTCDARGALSARRPSNPWGGSSYGQDALVGRGFDERVHAYMTSDKGRQLKEYLDRIKDKAQVNVHVVGHSLGGVSSAIFSEYLADYVKQQDFDKSKWRQYNFAFNSPRGMNEGFRDNNFYKLAKEGWFTPFGFNVSNDLVSEANCNAWARTYQAADGTGTPSNEDKSPLSIALDSGKTYQPFAQLAGDGLSPLARHRLQPATVGQWGAQSYPSMQLAYSPFVLGTITPGPDSGQADCGCDRYLEDSCPP